MTVVVRVWMPDRPGALGQVASRIGAVRGDVLAIEILEHGGGRAVDELVVRLPSTDLERLLTAEIDAVDGVSVESIRDADDHRADPSLSALGTAAAIAECDVDERLEVLCVGVLRLLEADWVVVLDGEETVHKQGDAAPADRWLSAFLVGSVHLDGVDDRAPHDLVWATLPTSGYTLAAGRTVHPIHERERVRVSLLTRLADALITPVR